MTTTDTFYVTPVMARGFGDVFIDNPNCPYNAQRHSIASFLRGELAHLPINSMVEIASFMTRGCYPLPCTPNSQVGRMLQESWSAWCNKHNTPDHLRHFYWKFFNPDQVEEDLSMAEATGNNSRAALNVITH
jgi:hypothetical protein